MLSFPKLKNFNELSASLPCSENGWVSVYFAPRIPWPTQLQTLDYMNQEFSIIPHTNNALPAIAVQVLANDPLEYQKKILNLSSVLSWKYGKGIEILGNQLSGRLICYQANNHFVRYLGVDFDAASLPIVDSLDCQLALALMRDARGLSNHHSSFAFLQFWKVLESTIGKGKIKGWISDELKDICNVEVKDKIGCLNSMGINDLPEHFFKSGRCAIAHAYASPIINPDDPTEFRRLGQELPIIEYLAELAVAKKFEI